ncbi:MAG: Holliday junction resolvase RuvX [Clostridia bacterium]
MKRILGVDYGEVRVGLAISDQLGITAQGIDNLVINKSDKKFIIGIKNIIEKYDIEKIIIGYPKNMDGTMSQKSKKIEEFIPKLEQLGVEVYKWDERLTTVSAYKTMKELGISQKKKNSYADKLAATYILEGYLNSLNKKQ